MTATWTLVGALGAATILIKASGPLLLGGRALPAWSIGLLRMLAPALLAALVATNVLVAGNSLVVDDRVIGIAVAFVALLLGAPTLLVVVLAAVTTALARLLLL
ncbi:MAG: AzlD domain-containing protein [Chloroflexota bacterium]|nr:AzlD domain-containing protein [Chloroflexota bacterium]MDE3193499.1 AzlD domain-containing protein [Chloroflexota bacterium]